VLGNEALGCACKSLSQIKLNDATIKHLTFMSETAQQILAEKKAQFEQKVTRRPKKTNHFLQMPAYVKSAITSLRL
jgi:hypothetical protein